MNRTSIFHLMRNLVPLHDQPLAICILFWLLANNISNVAGGGGGLRYPILAGWGQGYTQLLFW